MNFIAIYLITIITSIFMFCLGFYTGKTKEIPLENTFNKWRDKATYTETQEQKRQRIISENINNFGTDIPQQEVD